MYTGAPKRPSLYRSPAGAPHGDLGHLGRSGQIWGGPAYENDTPPACGLHWPCVKPLQSSPGSKGNGRKHARAPFSAVRATRKLKVDGFSSSRGALHDAHHEKAPNAKNPAAVGRRRAAGPLPPWGAARRRLAAFRSLPGVPFLVGYKTTIFRSQRLLHAYILRAVTSQTRNPAKI